MDEFCDGFFKLMDHLELDRVSKTVSYYKELQTWLGLVIGAHTWGITRGLSGTETCREDI